MAWGSGVKTMLLPGQQWWRSEFASHVMQVGLGGLPIISALRRWRWDSHSKLARQTSYTYKLCFQVRDSASTDKVESN